MKKSGIALRLMQFVAACVLSAFLAIPSAVAGGDPPPPPPIPLPPLPPLPDPCQEIPNPVYEACKVGVGCNLGPVGGTYCGISAASFCNRVTDPAKVAEDVAKIAAMAAICSVVPGVSSIPGMAGASLGTAAAACSTATAGAKPEVLQDKFCKDFIESVPDKLCPGPKTVNTCPWKN